MHFNFQIAHPNNAKSALLRAALDRSRPLARAFDRLEQIKASIRVIKQQFGHAKVRYWGLSKNKVRSLRRQFRG